MLALVLIAAQLCACGVSSNDKAKEQLPYPPADIQSCFRGAANIPDRALSVADVEALWKQDRIRAVAEAQCGKRLLEWYQTLQANWR